MAALKRIAVLGAGKMGLGIAQAFATKGFPVKVVYVYDDKTRYDARAVLRGNLEVLVRSEVLDSEQVPEILGRISFADSLEEVAGEADILFDQYEEITESETDNP